MTSSILRNPSVAYFSMETGLEPGIPTYAGGLGVLAGDTLRAAADLAMPLAGISLLYREGYIRQHLNEGGWQAEEPVSWAPDACLEPLPQRAEIELEGRTVQLRAWQYNIAGAGGHEVPVYLLDTDLPENDAADRSITDRLYGGDERHRLRQEAVLGMGGVQMLRALGHRDIAAYHMNEGHSALLVVALLREQLAGRPFDEATEYDIAAVRERCVFTTHTPVEAGHDRFPLPLVRQVLGDPAAELLRVAGCCPAETLNMTYLGLVASRFLNGVAVRHGEVSRGMFPGFPITSITNGVHAATWATPPIAALYDRYIPGWRRQNLDLRHAAAIPAGEVRQAHREAKLALLGEVRQRTGCDLSPAAMTVGFARRATAYKRTDLLFSDVERLRAMARRAGPLQMVYAGKAHPRDERGKEMIRHVFQAASALTGEVPVVYLEDYDMTLGRAMCGGVDLWLNNPLPPHEASGTSGMKAALNGVPSLSVLDGWWVEGHIEGVTGWSIGEAQESGTGDVTPRTVHDPAVDAAALYDKLERVIMPMFYRDPGGYERVMQSAIAHNGSFFNAERMLLQYARNAYHLPMFGGG